MTESMDTPVSRGLFSHVVAQASAIGVLIFAWLYYMGWEFAYTYFARYELNLSDMDMVETFHVLFGVKVMKEFLFPLTIVLGAALAQFYFVWRMDLSGVWALVVIAIAMCLLIGVAEKYGERAAGVHFLQEYFDYRATSRLGSRPSARVQLVGELSRQLTLRGNLSGQLTSEDSDEVALSTSPASWQWIYDQLELGCFSKIWSNAHAIYLSRPHPGGGGSVSVITLRIPRGSIKVMALSDRIYNPEQCRVSPPNNL